MRSRSAVPAGRQLPPLDAARGYAQFLQHTPCILLLYRAIYIMQKPSACLWGRFTATCVQARRTVVAGATNCFGAAWQLCSRSGFACFTAAPLDKTAWAVPATLQERDQFEDPSDRAAVLSCRGWLPSFLAETAQIVATAGLQVDGRTRLERAGNEGTAAKLRAIPTSLDVCMFCMCVSLFVCACCKREYCVTPDLSVKSPSSSSRLDYDETTKLTRFLEQFIVRRRNSSTKDSTEHVCHVVCA